MSLLSSRAWRALRPELLGLALLVPIVVVLGWLLYRWSSASPVATPSPSALVVSSPSPLLTSPLVEVIPTPASGSDVSEPSDAQENIATVVITAPNITARTYRVPLTRAANVAQVMTDAQAQGLTYVTKDYGGSLGLFFESINGLANDAVKQLYWHLYINGRRSPLGASSAQISLGDTIEWRLEAAESEEE